MAANKKKISIVGTIIKATVRAVIYAAILLLFYLGLTRAYLFGYSVFADTVMASPPGQEMTVKIEEGVSDSEVAKRLEEQGLIEDSKVFIIQSLFYDYTIYPGTYTLNNSMTVKEILLEISQKPEETQTSPEEAAIESENDTKEESTQ